MFYRFFDLCTVGDTKFLQLFSKFSGEFEDVVLLTQAPLSQEENSISQTVLFGSPADIPFDFRVDEMRFFLDIFSLFNPQIQKVYETKNAPPEDLPEN